MEKLSGLQKEFQKIKPSINKHNWRGINYPTTIDDWKIFEKNNPTVALNVLYTKKYVQFIFQHITQPVKNIILLMISNEEKEGQWYYLAVKKLAALFYRITSKNKASKNKSTV